MKKTLFRNARLVFPEKILPGSVLVWDGKIQRILGEDPAPIPGAETVDVGGCYLSPGFIDIHTHGAGGADFMDGDLESIYTACHAHFLHGTTSIVPTTLTSTKEALFDFVDLFDQVTLHAPACPNILGLHLEGPYFAPSQRGAQPEAFLRAPDPAEYETVLHRTGRILRWSFAVELPGAERFLACLKRNGVLPSLAHSAATCAQVAAARTQGLAALTHFYSGMESVRREKGFRIAGAVEAGYLYDDLYVEVIADGCHLPAELLALIYKIKGPDRICLVTDSMRAAGMPDGVYTLGNKDTGTPAVVEDGVAKLPDKSAFAGSVATTDRLVRTMRDLTAAPLHECVKMLSLTPATLLGIADRKGSIAEGKDADLSVFDEDIRVSYVMVGGAGTVITGKR